MIPDAEHDLLLREELNRVPAIDWAASLRAATQESTLSSLIQRILACVTGPGLLSIQEFFYYRLYDPVIPDTEVRKFVGKRRQHEFHKACNDQSWFAVCHDKALFYTLVKGAGLPAPRTVAVYALRRRTGLGSHVQTPEDLARFLRENDEWPLFAKPIDGMYALGALHLVQRNGDEIQTKHLGSVPIDALVEYLSKMSTAGYLFQEVVEPSPFATSSFSDTLPSIRYLVASSTNEPTLISSVVKIPSGASVADNFWQGGNMLGSVDHETGRIRRVIAGSGPSLHEVETHPASHVALTGLDLPQWQRFQECVLEAASLFPGIRTQSWDVAISRHGPMLLEVNFGGDLNLHQLAHGRGILTDEFIEHLEACGVKTKLR